MKRLFTLLFIVVSFSAQAQWVDCENYITFEYPDALYPIAVSIDTVNYPNNIWQIGKPHKTVFNSSLSLPNAIITDTINTYPPNDTSVFTLKLPGKILIAPSTFHFLYEFAFFYQLNIDTTTVATVEISVDNGMSWVNTLVSLPTYWLWASPIPNFSSSTSEWKQAKLAAYGGTMYDTVLFRFIFISDTTLSTKDGWMIDNISVWYWCEGAADNIKNENLLSLYPNPSKGNIHIHSNALQKQDAAVSVYNVLGQEVYKTENILPDGNLHLHLPDGIYTLKYFAGDEYCVKRVMITN